MTHAEEIMQAVNILVNVENKQAFSREEIRKRIGVTRDEWIVSYTSIFQGMRADQPGGAPDVSERFKGVFRQVRHSEHTLTDYGRNLLRNL